MPASLNHARSLFTGLKWSQIEGLVNVMRKYTTKQEMYIQKRYREHGTNYSETIAFLKSIGAITVRAGTLSLSVSLAELSGHELRHWVSGRLFKLRGKYKRELHQFLGKFEMATGRRMEYRPLDVFKSFESGLRNFLLELKVLEYTKQDGVYVMRPDFALEYMQHRASFLQISPEAIRVDIDKRLKLGLEAEKAVVEFEKKRLGDTLAHHVDHIAAKNAAAGFDILSLTVDPVVPLMIRLIEVKAVPNTSFQFFWTKNEQDCAEKFGPAYYLYLLPIGVNGRFELNGLLIVRDPFRVLRRSPNWIIQPDTLICRPTKVGMPEIKE